MHETLEQACRDDTQVAITVTQCEYKCCGGGWQNRNAGTYTGRVLSMTQKWVLLQCPNDLGKSAEMIAQITDISAVKPS